MTRISSLDEVFFQFENQDQKAIDLLELKSNVFQLLSAFINELRESSDKATILNPKDEAKILKAEQLLKAAIRDGFPTINVLAKEVGLSETKLKADFKALYGDTLFQYFSKAQMDLAEELIKTTDDPISQIAYSLGYGNAGKFSSAFKKVKHLSPSQIRNNPDRASN